MTKAVLLAACVLLGTSGAHAAPTFAGTSLDSEEMLPVALKCDDENGGTMEVVSRNRAGSVERLRLIVADGAPVRIVIAHAFMGAFENDGVIELAGRDADDMSAQDTIGYALALREGVCMAPAAERKRAYFSFKVNEGLLTEGP